MTIQRISTYSVHQRTLSDFNTVQSELFRLQKQLSSGYKTDKFSGLDGQVEQFTSIDATLRKTNTYIENNSLVLSRLNTTQVTLDKVIQVADDMENLLTLRRNPGSAQDINFQPSMDALRKTATSLLNSTFEGRFLFSGTRTDTPPIIEPLPEPYETGVPDDSYYKGGKQNLIVRAQDNFDIEYSVRADDPGFQKMYAAIDLALKGDAAADDDMISNALSLLQEGMEEIIGAQTKVNSNIVTLQNINERHTDLKLYWKGVKEEIINTDLVSVSTSVAIDQAILQATFQSFSTINQLRLSDFL